MSWHYSQALEAAYLAANYSDGKPSAQWSTTSTPEASLSQDKMTDALTRSLFGTMCKPSTENLGADLLTWYLADSHAKTSVRLVMSLGLQVHEVDCGSTWRELSMRYNLNSSLLKTHQCLWEEDLEPSSVTLPQWGITQGGLFWEQTTLGVITSANGVGYWLTPLKSGTQAGQKAYMKLTELVGMAEGYRPKYYDVPGMEDRPVFTGRVNPEWQEWLMGWPMGWTDETRGLATDRFQSWQRQHG